MSQASSSLGFGINPHPVVPITLASSCPDPNPQPVLDVGVRVGLATSFKDFFCAIGVGVSSGGPDPHPKQELGL